MTEELTGLEDLYRETTGKELDKFFRPPEGAFSPRRFENSSLRGAKEFK